MLVSVVMPTYNREKHIEKAINSVLAQSWQGELELIIVDDCSTDNTRHVVESFCDSRISYIENATNLGGGGARNVGAKAAKGEYLAFIDSDVVWYSNKLARQVELISSDTSVAVVYCAFKKQVATGWRVGPDFTPSGMVFERLLFDNFVDTPAAIVRRDAFWSVNGFDERLPRFQDWDLFLRLSNKFKFFGSDEVLFDSYTLPSAISMNDEARLNALQIIFDKFANEIRANSKIYRRFFFKFLNAYLLLDFSNDAVRFYSASYGTLWEGREGELVCETLHRIAVGIPLKSLYVKKRDSNEFSSIFQLR